MRPSRTGVSTYIETFTLIGIAIGGSAVIYSSASGYSRSAGGGSLTVSGLEFRQGPYVAVERILIANTGTTPFVSFVVSAAVPASAPFCVTLATPASVPVPFLSPPAPCGSGTTTDPSSINVTLGRPLQPGGALVMSVAVFSGREFLVGSRYSATVTTSAGGAQVATASATAG